MFLLKIYLKRRIVKKYDTPTETNTCQTFQPTYQRLICKANHYRQMSRKTCKIAPEQKNKNKQIKEGEMTGEITASLWQTHG